LGTTSEATTLGQLGLQRIFDRKIPVPSIKNHAELASVFRESQVFDNDSDLAECLNELRDLTSTDSVDIGIQQVLLAVGIARQDETNMVGRLAEVIAQQMAPSGETGADDDYVTSLN
jgi:vesicle-fusing ATPase